MKYKILGKTGIKVSEMCLGTMTFGTDWGWGADKAESQKMFDIFLKHGGNFIDTANIYTKQSSETFLGEFIQKERKNLVLATKYTLNEYAELNRSGNNRKNMIESVEESLRRLNTDYIDLYYVHAWDYLTDPEELMRNLEYLVSSGKVLTIGISDTPAWIVSRCNTIAEQRGWTPFSAYQVEYCLSERTVERDIIPCAEAYDMSIAAWGPLGAGLLTGKYINPDDSPKRMVPGKSRRLLGKNLEIAQKVMEVAVDSDMTPAQLAINWQRAQSPNISCLFGARSAAQCEENMQSLNYEITDEQLIALNETTQIDMGFPRDFLDTDRVRHIVYGGHYGDIEI